MHSHVVHRDRGESTTQLVVLVPLILLLLLLGVQAAVWFHAANVASAAAAQGAAAAAARGSESATGVTAAELTARDLGGRLVTRPVEASDGRTVTITVRLEVARVVPFFPAAVTRSATEPRERFVPEHLR